MIDRSLRANRGSRIADGRLADLRTRVEVFGFHLAKLDVRVHASDLAARDERVRRRSQQPAACAGCTARRRSTR